MSLLKRIVENEHFSFHESFETWEEALWAAAKPIIDDGSIEPSYVEKILANFAENGPYFVMPISPDAANDENNIPYFAMPHATPGEGAGASVHKSVLCFMRMEKPVVFFDPMEEVNREVKVFFVMAAADSGAHLENMMSLVDMLEHKGLFEELENATSSQELLSLSDKYSL